jgi:thiol-disulfide isomerase/thioredoxin
MPFLILNRLLNRLLSRRLNSFAGFMFAALLVGGFSWASAASAELTPLTAKEVVAKAANAKITIVNLWATWCAPCKEEMPELIRYYKSHATNGAQLLLVSGDSPSEFKEAAEFLAKLGADFPVYRLSEAPDAFMKNLGEPNWPAIVPTTLIYDQKAKRIGYWAKRVPMKELETIAAKALAKPSSGGASLATPSKKSSH